MTNHTQPKASPYLCAADNLAYCALNLAQLGQEIPEARASLDRVGGENAHAEDLGDLTALGGAGTARHLVLTHLCIERVGVRSCSVQPRDIRALSGCRGALEFFRILNLIVPFVVTNNESHAHCFDMICPRSLL